MKLHWVSLPLIALLLSTVEQHGQEEPNVAPQAPSAVSPTSGEKVYGQGDGTGVESDKSGGDVNDEEKSPLKGFIVSFVLLLVLLGCLFFLYKKGYIGKFRNTPVGRLKIKDQLMLGNRQFLLVVEYESREVLVGIGPGFIRHVCDLDGGIQAASGKFEETLADNLKSDAQDD